MLAQLLFTIVEVLHWVCTSLGLGLEKSLVVFEVTQSVLSLGDEDVICTLTQASLA